MSTSHSDFELNCRKHLDRFFVNRHEAVLQKRSMKALRLLAACGEPLRGKPEGWAAGIIYAAANRDRQACGVPGLLNSEFEQLVGVTMSTTRHRAAQIERLLDF